MYSLYCKCSVVQPPSNLPPLLAGNWFPAIDQVVKAMCPCTAQGGKCWHVGALLWVIFNLLRPEDHVVSSSPTARNCRWNKPGKGISDEALIHTPLRLMQFEKHDAEKDLRRAADNKNKVCQNNRRDEYIAIPNMLPRTNTSVEIARAKLWKEMSDKLGQVSAAEMQYAPHFGM